MHEWLAAGERDGMVQPGLGSDESLDGLSDIAGSQRIGNLLEILRAGGALNAAGGRLGAGRRRVAVGAIQVAADEAQKNLPLADKQAFALDGGEDFKEGGGHGGVFVLVEDSSCPTAALRLRRMAALQKRPGARRGAPLQNRRFELSFIQCLELRLCENLFGGGDVGDFEEEDGLGAADGEAGGVLDVDAGAGKGGGDLVQ